MQHQYHPPTVTAVFACGVRGTRDIIRMYAQIHREITVAATPATGQELLAWLGAGNNAQVLVLDASLPDISLAALVRQVNRLQLVPPPALLLTAQQDIPAKLLYPVSNLLTFAPGRGMLRPYTIQELFAQTYALAADGTAQEWYALQNRCAALLDVLQAGYKLSGRRYVERMALHAALRGQEVPLGELLQQQAEEECVSVGTIISAVNRLSSALQQRGTPLYGSFCTRCGLPPTGRLSTGQLVGCLAGELCRPPCEQPCLNSQ